MADARVLEGAGRNLEKNFPSLASPGCLSSTARGTSSNTAGIARVVGLKRGAEAMTANAGGPTQAQDAERVRKILSLVKAILTGTCGWQGLRLRESDESTARGPAAVSPSPDELITGR